MATLTRNQNLVLSVLADHAAAMSAYQILDALRPAGLRAPAQIYRALDHLVASGRAHRIESLNAYVACDGGSHHAPVAFAICDRCQTIAELPAAGESSRLQASARSHDFAMDHATIEIHGLCRRCASRPQSGPPPGDA
ncbi:MAG: Fur family transcriptional regulator [Alphaproteobacteria bacterium]